MAACQWPGWVKIIRPPGILKRKTIMNEVSKMTDNEIKNLSLSMCKSAEDTAIVGTLYHLTELMIHELHMGKMPLPLIRLTNISGDMFGHCVLLPGSKPRRCIISIDKAAITAGILPDRFKFARLILMHEMVHCFSYFKYPASTKKIHGCRWTLLCQRFSPLAGFQYKVFTNRYPKSEGWPGSLIESYNDNFHREHKAWRIRFDAECKRLLNMRDSQATYALTDEISKQLTA